VCRPCRSEHRDLTYVDISVRQRARCRSHYFTSRAQVTGQLLTVSDVIIRRYETRESRRMRLRSGRNPDAPRLAIVRSRFPAFRETPGSRDRCVSRGGGGRGEGRPLRMTSRTLVSHADDDFPHDLPKQSIERGKRASRIKSDSRETRRHLGVSILRTGFRMFPALIGNEMEHSHGPTCEDIYTSRFHEASQIVKNEENRAFDSRVDNT